MHRRTQWIFIATLGLGTLACREPVAPAPADETDGTGDEAGPGEDSVDDTGTTGGSADDSADDDSGMDDGEPSPTSPTANVRQKAPRQLRNDFAQALGLPPEQLCEELGGLSCTDEVHTVTLGGVEPDELGIYSPAQHSSATTPIAVERVALAACGRRVDADLAGAPVIFDVPREGAALSDVDDPAVTTAITTLYRRALLRDPTPVELAHVRDLYAAVEGTGTDAPARDWAVGTCFAVLTTMESIFY